MDTLKKVLPQLLEFGVSEASVLDDFLGNPEDQIKAAVDDLMKSIRSSWPGEEFVQCRLTATLPFPITAMISKSPIVTPGATIVGVTAIGGQEAITLG